MSSETYPRVIERHNARAELRKGDRIRLSNDSGGIATHTDLTLHAFDDWGNVVSVEGPTVNVWSDTTLTLLERPKKPLPKPGDTVLVLGSTDPDVECCLPLIGFVDWDGGLNGADLEDLPAWVGIDSLTDWKLLTIEDDKVVTHD